MACRQIMVERKGVREKECNDVLTGMGSLVNCL